LKNIGVKVQLKGKPFRRALGGFKGKKGGGLVVLTSSTTEKKKGKLPAIGRTPLLSGPGFVLQVLVVRFSPRRAIKGGTLFKKLVKRPRKKRRGRGETKVL